MAYSCRLMGMSSSPRTGSSFWELLVTLKVYKKVQMFTVHGQNPSRLCHLSTCQHPILKRQGIGGQGVHSVIRPPSPLQQLTFPTLNMVWICTCPPPHLEFWHQVFAPSWAKSWNHYCCEFFSLIAPSYIVTRSMPVASIFRLKKMAPTPIPQLTMTTVGGLQMRSTTAEVIKILAGRKKNWGWDLRLMYMYRYHAVVDNAPFEQLSMLNCTKCTCTCKNFDIHICKYVRCTCSSMHNTGTQTHLIYKVIGFVRLSSVSRKIARSGDLGI